MSRLCRNRFVINTFTGRVVSFQLEATGFVTRNAREGYPLMHPMWWNTSSKWALAER